MNFKINITGDVLAYNLAIFTSTNQKKGAKSLIPDEHKF